MTSKAPTKNYFLKLLGCLYLSLIPLVHGWYNCYSQQDGTVFPVPGECQLYILCLNHMPFTKTCNSGESFSVTAGGCVELIETNCHNNTVVPSPVLYESQATCDNERRSANRMACMGQRFGELVPYPGDCSKFLVCNCEYPTVKQCPGGTWFDNTIKVCNYPGNVICIHGNEGSTSTTEAIGKITALNTSPTTARTSNGKNTCVAPDGISADTCLNYPEGFLLPYPYNCNAYINCTAHCPVMNYCQTGKVFNKFLKICDTPDTAHCRELPYPNSTVNPSTVTTEILSTSTEAITTEEIKTTITSTYPSTITTEKPPTSPEAVTTDEINTKPTATSSPEQCITPLAVEDNICSALYQDKYQPYPYNCTAYIKCNSNVPCLEYCETGKIFNSLLGICDQDIECKETSLTTIPKQETTTPFTTIGVSSSLPPHIDPALCQGKKDNTVYAFEENCSRYLLCESDEVKLEHCPDNWFFNAKLRLCDEGDEEACLLGTNTATEEPSTETTSGEAAYQPCLNQSSSVTFPYKQNCQLYYYCRGNGHYYIISCPYDNFYDPYTGNCGPDVSPQACQEPVTTAATPTTRLTTLSANEKCANESKGVTYALEEDCSKYIYCKGHGGFLIINCPNNNYYYPDTGDCGPSADKNICRQPKHTTLAMTTTTLDESTIPDNTIQPLFDLCANNISGQLIPYPNNCNKYISCIKPIPIAFYCNNNWRFDENEQKCIEDVHSNCISPQSNGTGEASGICYNSEEGNRHTFPRNCQLYYECLGSGHYMLLACGQGTYFDPLNGECSSHVGPEFCQQNFGTTLSPSTATESISKPEHICEGQMLGSKVSYPHNCSKYILCETPIPTAFNCANGLEFSSLVQACVEPLHSDCGMLTEQTTIGSTSTPAFPPTTLPTSYNQCTNETDFTLLPYQHDCSLFIMCLHNLEHLAYCGRGKYFDISAKQCSPNANEYSCVLGTTTDSPYTTTQDPNLGPCYDKPNGTRIPYPHNCSKYIECREPLNVGYDCPNDLEFNMNEQSCVSPELADCSVKTTSSLAPTTDQTTIRALETCENKPTGTTLPYRHDCSKYYTCISGREKLTNCMPNSYYNPAVGECDTAISPNACTSAGSTTSETTTTKPTTQTPQGPCSNLENGFIYASNQNCSQYYICYQETSVLCLCQNNTFYDPHTESCDIQVSNTACSQETITTTATVHTSTAETRTFETTQSETTTSAEATMEITTTSTTTEPSTSNICCGQENNTHLSYPGDETKYVICRYPLPVIYTCPEDTIYVAGTSGCH